MAASHRDKRRRGFTLVETSVVLVIIGLIVGGILVGLDLVHGAEVRATISQMQKYQAAVHTFQNEYGFLPGDIPDPYASQFGFRARGTARGQGDGNGIIEQWNCCLGLGGANGEQLMFWVDLSTAGLIDGGFSTATSTVAPGSSATGAILNQYLPQAKIGGGNYVYVFSGGWGDNAGTSSSTNGINYYGISAAYTLGAGCNCLYSNPGLTVQQAYAIDSKIDDGNPLTGNVLAAYISSNNWIWRGFPDNTPPPTSALGGSSTTCYDNGNNSNNPMQYSTKQNGGSGVNCGLTFQFQ